MANSLFAIILIKNTIYDRNPLTFLEKNTSENFTYSLKNIKNLVTDHKRNYFFA